MSDKEAAGDSEPELTTTGRIVSSESTRSVCTHTPVLYIMHLFSIHNERV